MSPSTNPGTAPAAFRRRSFLGLLGAGAAATALPSVLGGCSSAATSAPAPTAIDSAILPNYKAVEYAKPDIPSVNGSTPGYTTIPKELVQSVPTAPGTGRTITAMTPLWGTIPPSNGNQYYEAVNGILGSEVEFQITDGNVYGDKLAAVLASAKDVPDWVQIPSWVIPPRFGSEIVQNVFTDLTPFLAGSAVDKYPNLANIPTDAWKACVWNGKLYGLPYPDTVIRDATYYRKDILDERGITPDVKSAEDLLALAKELTDPSKNQWGAEDPWSGIVIAYGVPPKWRLDDAGWLINRVETPEYRAALEAAAKFFAAGVVHPDAVADQASEAKSRFQSGKSLIMCDGTGGWNEALRDNLASNPDYAQQAFAPFAGDGGEPLLWKGNGANMFSFIKKTDDTALVEEMLAMANVLAAPFGTTEFDLINNGKEGVHFTRGADGVPKPTALAAKELQPTYIFLVDPPVVEAKVQYPGFVEAMCTWMAEAAPFAKEPLFYGQQITEPTQFASIAAPFTDLEKDIARGRKSLSDLDAAIAEWKASGGDQLRDFYQKILDQQ
ncbi:extracellular solute-binding protein [Microlunatus lacustris]